jgi:hypothetical protein
MDVSVARRTPAHELDQHGDRNVLQDSARFSERQRDREGITLNSLNMAHAVQLFHMRQLTAHRRTDVYTIARGIHADTHTHRSCANRDARIWRQTRHHIDVHMRDTRKICGHLHPQIRTARESSLMEASIFETRPARERSLTRGTGRGATCSRPSSTVHACPAETTLGAP